MNHDTLSYYKLTTKFTMTKKQMEKLEKEVDELVRVSRNQKARELYSREKFIKNFKV